jgi:tetratricopeptide (TPR) repeat protein
VSDTLAWIYYKRGVYARALDLLNESARELPDNPVIQYHLGMVQLKQGDRGAARQALERALRLSRTFPGAREAEQALAELGKKG